MSKQSVNTSAISNNMQPSKINGSVVFSEYPLWICVAFAFFLTIAETIFGYPLRNVSVLKHMPLAMFLPSFAFYLICRTIRGAIPVYTKGIFLQLWPFLLLGLFATLGSLYARLLLDIKETFLILGVYLLAMPLFFIWGRETSNTARVIRPYMLLWGIFSTVAVFGAAFYFKDTAALHNIEFLVPPFLVYCFFSNQKTSYTILLLVLIALVAILSQKLTGYIISVCAFSYILVMYMISSVAQKWRNFFIVLSGASVTILVGAVALGYFYFQEHLPSGNINVRMHQYRSVFESFMESPLWGTGYLDGSGELYVEYNRRLNIPTHSDILDLLKQGGALAFGLWAIGMVLTIKLFIQRALQSPKSAAFFHAMAFFAIATTITCAINPIFLAPPSAFVIWGGLALALGIATDSRKGQHGAI